MKKLYSYKTNGRSGTAPLLHWTYFFVVLHFVDNKGGDFSTRLKIKSAYIY
ncbi:hypothetical protein U6A24_22385 [Aquimarina gracilis]|uniref:Uncharacterized protein n=1 Tax=Aquimarina gracilis TaxID=874422 RepID=A0ABU6A2E5_9FLAO|nr:hypothetical protein [Aquimarina gracilis]MEB3348243.1 hypothetical protein [Aquimarina gracilis]